MSRWKRVLIAILTYLVRIVFAEWRRRRTRRPSHDTVSCEEVYIVSEVIMCSNVGVAASLSEEQRLAIAGFLRVFVCGCPSGGLSCFGSTEGDSLYVEQSCPSCGQTTSVYWEKPSFTPVKTEVLW